MPKSQAVRAIFTIIYARGENGKLYVLSLQRSNTRKFNRQLMFGAAGKKEVDKDPNLKTTFYREFQEELLLLPEKILKRKVIGTVKNINGFSGPMILTEISIGTLRELVFDINKNPKRYWEVKSARINRVKSLGKRPELLVPHYLSALPRIKSELKVRERNRLK